jgi:hypothetical protein
MEGVAVKPLTVGFHETQFLGKLNGENKLGFWFQLSDRERQRAGEPWGPSNPQALNRYAYVLNNPLKYTDPNGHSVYLSESQAADLSGFMRGLAEQIERGASAIATGATIAAVVESILGWAAQRIATMATPATFYAGILAGIATWAAGALYQNAMINVASDLKLMADLIDKYNMQGGSGVIIGAACWGRLSTCQVSIISRDTGDGMSYITRPGTFEKGFWNDFFGASLSRGQYFEPGRACTLEGGNVDGRRWKVDTMKCRR